VEGVPVIQRFVPASIVVRPSEGKVWRIWDAAAREFLADECPDEDAAWERAEALNWAEEAAGFADGEAAMEEYDRRAAARGHRRCGDCPGAMHTVAKCPERGNWP
jgi:hypothetical protein